MVAEQGCVSRISWELTPWSTSRRQRELTQNGMGIWNLKACSQWHTSSNKATPPNPSQTALPTGDQAFKCRSHSRSNHQLGIINNMNLSRSIPCMYLPYMYSLLLYKGLEHCKFWYSWVSIRVPYTVPYNTKRYNYILFKCICTCCADAVLWAFENAAGFSMQMLCSGSFARVFLS